MRALSIIVVAACVAGVAAVAEPTVTTILTRQRVTAGQPFMLGVETSGGSPKLLGACCWGVRGSGRGLIS